MALKKSGGCLCGAVRFEVELPTGRISVCHCQMCRRWTGGPLFGVHVQGDVAFRGDEKIGVYRASDWGERGFCRDCGTTLFWRLQDRSMTALPAGAFDDQDGFELKLEIYVDEQPAFYGFAQKAKRMTGPEFLKAWRESQD